MLKLKEQVCHDEKFDVDINRYLTYAQIQQIVNAVEKEFKNDDSWATYQTNIDMLVLLHATNITKEELEEAGHDLLVQSGLIETVRESVRNMQELYNAFEYTDSIKRQLYKLMKELPKHIDKESIQKAVKVYAKQG